MIRPLRRRLMNKPAEQELVQPYKNSEEGKKSQVEAMFDNIAGRYDFLNHFLSLGIDKSWRRKAIGLLKSSKPQTILDVATGTGDFAIAAMKLNPEKVVGIDLSEKMLDIGREKIRKRGLQEKIELLRGDSEYLDFKEASFNAAIAAFGVRNFENLPGGLEEMFRVLKPDGQVVILEFSQPGSRFIRALYYLYFFRILPAFGRLVSKDRFAYSYLPESVGSFPSGEGFLSILEKTGFSSLKCHTLSMGIACIYTGMKEAHNNKSES